MKIFLASDHGGFELKQDLYDHLLAGGHMVEDLGPDKLDPEDDYPQFAKRVTTKLRGEADPDARGILICRGGQGMAMAANRVPGIRAAVVWNEAEAKATRNDNDSNVLSLAADHIDLATMLQIVDTWLTTPFSAAPRHSRRLAEIEDMNG